MDKCMEYIERLEGECNLKNEEFLYLLEHRNGKVSEFLFEKSRKKAQERFKNRIYTRGLIEFTNYCKNDCYYCGIRAGNRKAARYRLSERQIVDCCIQGYQLGFRTFVLQGGEDPYYTDERMVGIISSIKSRFPDCAVTISFGERERESYQRYFDAGADRYLLRHETANEEHYGKLHPKSQTLKNRKRCLWDLKEIGFQVGTGMMIGSPYQTYRDLVEDLNFIKELDPQMVGIGPFVPHHETPFANERQGSVELTLFMLGLIRLMLPDVLLPATTALGTIDRDGREKGILAGANVVMPNLSPVEVRKSYELYDNKICTGEEAAESRENLQKRMRRIGYELAVDRGDFKRFY